MIFRTRLTHLICMPLDLDLPALQLPSIFPNSQEMGFLVAQDLAYVLNPGND